jgi:hypothetical protein
MTEWLESPGLAVPWDFGIWLEGLRKIMKTQGQPRRLLLGSVLISAVGAVMVMLRHLICPILVPKKHALTMYYWYSVYSQKDMQLLTTWHPPPPQPRLTADMKYCLFTIVLGCLVLIRVVEPGGGIPCHSTRLLLNLKPH